MKKITGVILILVAAFCSAYSFSPVFAGVTGITSETLQDKKQDRIFWTDKPVLTFADFKADINKDPMFSDDYSEDFRVLAKIRKTILVQKKTVGKMAKFKVYAAMIRDGSWIKNPNDTASLRHEQAHYDLCEIYARMLRKELILARSMDDAKQMFMRITDREMAEQNLFDAENSGYKDGIKPEWAESISKRLKELEVYKNPVVVISLRD